MILPWGDLKEQQLQQPDSNGERDEANPVEILSRLESGLLQKEGEHISHIKTSISLAPVELTLFSDERLEFSLARLHIAPLDPAAANETLDQSLKQTMYSSVISANDDFWTETAESLGNGRTRSNSGEDSACQLLQKASTVSLELCPVVGTFQFVQRLQKTAPNKKIFFLNWGE